MIKHQIPKGTEFKEKVVYDRERYRKDGVIIPNAKYRIGLIFEYEVRDWLRDRGWLVMRSAGSKSPVDLVAVRNNQVLLVQCKKGTKPAKAERTNLSILEGRTGKSIQVLLAYKRKYGRKIEWFTFKEGDKLVRIYI